VTSLLRQNAPPSRRGLLVMLGALSMFAPLATDMFLPGLPALRANLHTNAALANLALTAAVLGLGLGQLLAGPLSDSRGRSLPLRIGLVGFTLASVLCALSPSIWPLIVARFVQGLGGGAAIVIARAIVRDVYGGVRAAQLFATLMMASNIAPVIAPVIGGGVLVFTDWRGIFVVLTLIGVAQLAGALWLVPETLPADRREPGGMRRNLGAIGRLLRDRRFAPLMWSFALSFCVLFAYISAGSYVFENVYRVSPQVFAAIFAGGSLALAAVSRACVPLVRRFSPERLTRWGLYGTAVTGMLVLFVAIVGRGSGGGGRGGGIWLMLAAIFLMMITVGVVLTNAVAAAMIGQRAALGAASALIGLAQFGLGALVAPLVGLGGAMDAVPMGIVMAVCGLVALGVNLVFSSPAKQPA
jgi:DHA1 family bicyclomycin/chloramphenicol resistance-like MFS transporter